MADLHAKRNQTIAKAIERGQILAASAASYAKLYDADPSGTEATISRLASSRGIAEANAREIGEDIAGYVAVSTQ